MKYKDFVIRLSPDGVGAYRSRILSSPKGKGTACFVCPFDLISVPEISKREIGESLYRALFVSQLQEQFEASLDAIAHRPNRGLRIKLNWDAGDPASIDLNLIPWELLYRPSTRQFLALSRKTPIVRYPDLPHEIIRQPMPPQLRVLVVSSEPDKLAALGLEREYQLLADILGKKGIKTHCLRNPTRKTLRAELLNHTYQVLHIMGHGGFLAGQEKGVLVFPKDSEGVEMVSGESLAGLIGDFHGKIPLVVLNCCYSATEAGADHAGLASAVALAGFPAVVAMQGKITNLAATAFCASFYGRIAQGDAVDTAVGEGRQAIWNTSEITEEWDRPVVFLRPRDARIFDPKVFFPFPNLSIALPKKALSAIFLIALLWQLALLFPISCPVPQLSVEDSILVEGHIEEWFNIGNPTIVREGSQAYILADFVVEKTPVKRMLDFQDLSYEMTLEYPDENLNMDFKQTHLLGPTILTQGAKGTLKIPITSGKKPHRIVFRDR